MKHLTTLLRNASRRITAMLIVGALFIVSACKNDDGPDPKLNTIVALAQDTPQLSFLVTALSKFPDLVGVLSSEGSYTVFAPTNDAFTFALGATGQSSIDDLPEEVLANFLSYHVIGTGALTAGELGSTIEAANGENITVTQDGSAVKLNGATNVVTANIIASNGVIHIIDRVLIPPTVLPIVGTVVAPAYFNKNFTTLIAAVEAASPDVLALLLNADQKTVFAPTNDAFVAAGITSLPDETTLNAVLSYHVLPGRVTAADLPTGSATVTTAGGDFYLSNNGADGVFINGTTEVVATDILATNGVVHVIDRVLLPPSKTIAQIAEAATMATTPEFTILVAALARTSGQGADDLLAAAGNADAALTVFAPTDAAFNTLLSNLNLQSIDDVPLADLIAILKHHIVGARVFSTDLTDGAVATLNGNVTISATNGTITDGSSGTANLTTSLNILGTNGVIHVIDAVLIP
jgi:transforming growth factor-beta-induced protein